MRTQPIGSGSLVSTRLAYGCMRLAGTMERARFTAERDAFARRAVLAAVEAGYTHFDHADIYGNGLCEEIFGRVLEHVPGLRERIVIATKCGIRWAGDPTPDAPHRWDFSREHILRSCDASLARLGIERIDLYLLHRPDFLADPHEIAAAFDALARAGKVREFGVSNFRPSQLAMLASVCPMPLVANQIEVHPARLAPFEDGTLDQCLERGITPVAWSPLAGGWLGDGGEAPAGPHARAHHALLDELDATAHRHGVSRTVVVLAWLLRHPARIIPLVGSVEPARIRDATRADALELTREEWYRILVAARGEGLP